MKAYQAAFLELCLELDVLRFGQFTLKSGRESPYFFNAGLFNTGASLKRLGEFYAEAIIDSDLVFDMLFGPAYKGIPLAAAISIAFAQHHQRDIPYAYNRKEVKDHGEGGELVGAPLAGRVLVVDDVISAGTSVRESAGLIEFAGAEFAGVAIALDRQERGQTERSAVEEVIARFGIEVVSVVGLNTLIEFLARREGFQATRERVLEYRAAHGSIS
jgi:orotate phosphoribosyltransferase